MKSFGRPSADVNVENFPSLKRLKPSGVPIHRLSSRSTQSDKTMLLARPSFEVKCVVFPSLREFSPPSYVPIQRLPFRSSRSDKTMLLESPSLEVYEEYLPFRRRFKPSAVPIHKLPSLSS